MGGGAVMIIKCLNYDRAVGSKSQGSGVLQCCHRGSIEALTAQTGTVEYVVMLSAMLCSAPVIKSVLLNEFCDELCCHVCQTVVR